MTNEGQAEVALWETRQLQSATTGLSPKALLLWYISIRNPTSEEDSPSASAGKRLQIPELR